jgi:protein SSD1
VEELFIRTNSFVGRKIAAGLPEKALLRRHSPPNQRRIENFAERMNRYKQDIDVSSSAALQTSLYRLQDPVVRQVRLPCSILGSKC